jgi:hypothetical protein
MKWRDTRAIIIYKISDFIYGEGTMSSITQTWKKPMDSQN